MNNRGLVASSALLALAIAGGCSPEKNTQLVAGVTSQMQVPKELKSVGMVIQSGGRVVFCENYVVEDGSVTLPSTLGLKPANDPNSPVTVTVLGFKVGQDNFTSTCVVKVPEVGEDDVLVLRRRRSPYIEDRVLYLPLPLKRSCAASEPCGADKTCLGGVCTSAEIDPNTLVDYSDPLIFGGTGTCFSVSQCASVYGSQVAKLVDGNQCLFEAQVPQGVSSSSSPGLNVRITYDNFTPEILDRDKEEGFTIPDSSKPLQFQLASNLCSSNYRRGAIVAVQASPVCASKTPLQPICTDDLKALQKGTEMGQTAETLCVKEGFLKPAQSALMVLMDQSASMSKYFGDTAFGKVLSLSLQDPVLENAEVGFKLMPAPSCSADPTYKVGFLEAKEARSAIATIVGEAKNLWTTDGPVNLHGAMAGAYQLLEGLQGTYHRRALLIIGNRGFAANECQSPTYPAPNTLAQQKLAQSVPIHTYVLQVGGVANPETATAEAIAIAGGTTFFNGTSGDDAAGAALQTILGDLASCVYEKSALLPSDLSTAKLSYFNPTSGFSPRTNVDYVPNCNSLAQGTRKGWFIDAQQRVIVCDDSCTPLRSAAKAVSVYAASVESVSPGFHLKVSVPCN